MLLMRTWDEVCAYVRARYQFQEPGDGYIYFYSIDRQGAAEAVFVARAGGPEVGLWVEMTAPVGDLNEIDVNVAAQRVGFYHCGGISTAMGLVLVRHTLPIELISESSFEAFRIGVTGVAKALRAEARR